MRVKKWGLSKKETCLRGRGRGQVAEIKPYFYKYYTLFIKYYIINAAN